MPMSLDEVALLVPRSIMAPLKSKPTRCVLMLVSDDELVAFLFIIMHCQFRMVATHHQGDLLTLNSHLESLVRVILPFKQFTLRFPFFIDCSDQVRLVSIGKSVLYIVKGLYLLRNDLAPLSGRLNRRIVRNFVFSSSLAFTTFFFSDYTSILSSAGIKSHIWECL